jgi:hypothetical protein
MQKGVSGEERGKKKRRGEEEGEKRKLSTLHAGWAERCPL